MRLVFAVILLVACCLHAHGQRPLALRWKRDAPFSASPTDSTFTKVALGPENNIFSAVQIGGGGVTVTKFTFTGHPVFTNRWPSSGLDSRVSAKFFTVDHAGNSILVAFRTTYSPPQTFLHYVSYDRLGALRWDVSELLPPDANGPYFHSSALDHQNNLILAGSLSNKLSLRKISSAGAVTWRYQLDHPDLQYTSARDVAVDAAGRIYAVGRGLSNTTEIRLFLAVEGDQAREFWTHPGIWGDLTEIHATDSGAFYTADARSIFRIDATGKTEWSRFTEGNGTFPTIVPFKRSDMIAAVTGDTLTIFDQSGTQLGNARFAAPNYGRHAEASAGSLIIGTTDRIYEVRTNASLISEVFLEEGSFIQDIAVAENAGVAFIGERNASNGVRSIFTGALIYSISAAAPNIITHPSGGIVVSGRDFTTTVEATGSDLSYQWFVTSPGSDRAALEGQTNSALTLTNMQTSQSGKYSVEVRNGLGNLSSEYAQVGVHVIPKIISDPKLNPARPYVGDHVFWQVFASFTSPISFQWFKDGQPIPRATNFNYSISSAGPADVGKYSVLITNLVGEARSVEVDFPRFLENVTMNVVTNDLNYINGNFARDAQNNVYLTAGISVDMKLVPIVAKFDENGHLLRTTKIPSLSAVSFERSTLSALAQDGSVYIPGSTSSIPVLCKVDSTGGVAWTASLRNQLNSISGIQRTPLHTHVAGFRTSTNRAIVVVAFNDDGAQARTTAIRHSTLVTDTACWLAATPDNHLYLASRGLRALYAIDPSGAVLWTNSFPTNLIVDMKTGPANSVHIAALYGGRAACLKFNAAGQKVWTALAPARLGSFNFDSTQLEVDPYGNSYIAHAFSTVVAKIDPWGKLLSTWSPVGVRVQDQGQLRTTDTETVYMLRFQNEGLAMSNNDAGGFRRWSRILPVPLFFGADFFSIDSRNVLVFGRNTVVKVQDQETPELQQLTATIERGIAATNPVLRAVMYGPAPAKLTWYISTIPTSPFGSGESIVPRYSVTGSYYALEVETEDSVLVTPDYFFDAFTMINDARLADGNFHFNMQGFANLGFRLQRSLNLIDWEDYGPATFDTNGTSVITAPISDQRQTEFFRAVK